MNGNTEWLRGRGIGRERFAGYLADYLTELGYEVARAEETEPPRSRVAAHLAKMNPSIPTSAKELSFTFYPTSGGCGAAWDAPRALVAGDEGRMDRFVRELTTHLERVIATESHMASKVVRPPVSQLPWRAPTQAAEPA